jgi:hypothetical protein
MIDRARFEQHQAVVVDRRHWPKGCIARYCGDFWSSGPISTTS